MKEFELPLSKDYQRPIINTGQIDALVLNDPPKMVHRSTETSDDRECV